MSASDSARIAPEAALASAEFNGIRLALIAKAGIIVVMSVFLIVNFDAPALYWPLAFAALFVGTGLAQWWMALNRPSWIWFQAATVVVDSVALAVVIAVPNPWSGFDLPAQIPFRNSYFVLLIIYVVSVGFTYRPMIALAAGAGCAAAWVALSVRVHFLPETVGFGALPQTGVDTDDLVRLFGETHFFSTVSRVTEVIAIVLAAILVAGLVQRSRRQVMRVLQAEEAREQARAEQALIRELFGKYVPPDVATEILSDKGQLHPQTRQATIMFVDLEGFTTLAERLSANELLDVLNDYFQSAGQLVNKHKGTIAQFQGDGFLAGFNVPVQESGHAANAINAARELLSLVETREFGGQHLSIRIGIHTGELVAGALGDSNRLSYTVIGNTVNVTARLEQLNKETRTRVLISQDTVSEAGDVADLAQVGSYSLQGLSEKRSLFTLR